MEPPVRISIPKTIRKSGSSTQVMESAFKQGGTFLNNSYANVKENMEAFKRHVREFCRHSDRSATTTALNTGDDWAVPTPSKRHGSQISDLGSIEFKKSLVVSGDTAILSQARLLYHIGAIILELVGIPFHLQGHKKPPTAVLQAILTALLDRPPQDPDEPLVDAGADRNGGGTNYNPAKSNQSSFLQPHSYSKAGESSRSRKGRSTRRQGDEPPDDEDNQLSPSSPAARTSNGGDELPFACPVHVHDAGSGWCQGGKRIVDVRQHLHRKHIQLSHCPTCGLGFPKDPTWSLRNEHIKQRSCIPSAVPSYPGVTEEKWDAIRRRARDHKTRSDDERWYEIWDILYPDSQRPASTRIRVTDEFSMRVHDMVSKYCESSAMETIIDETTVDRFDEVERAQYQAYFQNLCRAVLRDLCSFVERGGVSTRQDIEHQRINTTQPLSIAPTGHFSNNYTNPSPLFSPAPPWTGADTSLQGMPGPSWASPVFNVTPLHSMTPQNADPFEVEDGDV